MGMARAFVAGVCATALSGCMWAMPGANVDRTAHNGLETAISPATVGDLEVAWTGTTDAHGVGDPVVSSDGVFVTAADDFDTYAFHPETGARRWKRTEPSGVQLSQPSIVGGNVVVGRLETTDPAVDTTLTLDPATGAELASVPGGRLDGQRGNRQLIVRTWYERIETPAGPRYVPQADLIARDPVDPTFGWAGHVSAYPERRMTLGYDFVYDAGHGVGDIGLRAYAVHGQPPACTGPDEPAVCPSWSLPLPGAGSVTTPVLRNGGEVVYVGTAVGTLYAVDGTTGSVLWSTPVGPGIGAAPALANSVLYVPAYGPTLNDGKLVALDADDGTELWSAPLPYPPTRHQPAVAGGVVFVPGSPGELRAYDGAAGTLLWNRSVGGADTLISGAPAVANGKVFVGTQDGRVVAFGIA